ncbi:O-antigen ligase family protein [Pseudomonas profundi]|uniref:O-antigen ligase family protein n=1 Tax=Pseudomonas profundi TaxID=1981513 RepID=UPI00123B8013|nr:O-antigen ligase family protein [Pseudomonas profundi]
MIFKEESSSLGDRFRTFSPWRPEFDLDGMLRGWLSLGVIWFLVGVALVPSSKPYNQLLILLFWLPALIISFREREAFRTVFSDAKPLIVGLVLLFAWSGISVLWAENVDPFRELKRLFYVVLFLAGLAFVARDNINRLAVILSVAGIGLAGAALVSLVLFYGIRDMPLTSRLEGVGLLEHPIIGGYLIAIAFLWLLSLPPTSLVARVGWIVGLIVLLAFIVMTQSRGLWVALLSAQLGYAILRGGAIVWIGAVVMIVCAGIGFWQFESIVLQRGMSYRPDIFVESIRMILARPAGGLGLGGEYDVLIGGLIIPHSHNLFLHIGLELGLVGLAIWLWIWGCCVKAGWQHRETRCGSALLKIILFCTVALMFDGNSLWTAPRPDWFFSWFPIGLALAVFVSVRGGAEKAWES